MLAHLAEGLLVSALGLVGIVDGLFSLRRTALLHEFLPPGWYLIGVSAALLVCGAAYLVGGWKRVKAGSMASEFRPGAAVVVWGAMAGYAILTPLLGYALASFVFFVVVLYSLGVRPWPRAGLVSLIFTVVFYLGFVKLAHLLMPRGLVERMFG